MTPLRVRGKAFQGNVRSGVLGKRWSGPATAASKVRLDTSSPTQCIRVVLFCLVFVMLRSPCHRCGCLTTLTQFELRPEIIYGLRWQPCWKGGGWYLWDGLHRALGRKQLRLPSHDLTLRSGRKE